MCMCVHTSPLSPSTPSPPSSSNIECRSRKNSFLIVVDSHGCHLKPVTSYIYVHNDTNEISFYAFPQNSSLSLSTKIAFVATLPMMLLLLPYSCYAITLFAFVCVMLSFSRLQHFALIFRAKDENGKCHEKSLSLSLSLSLFVLAYKKHLHPKS
jgi:hypothetical protein